MSNAASVNVFPLVTPWLALNELAASSRVFPVSTIAQCDAVPVPVTEPSVIAATVTLRPLGLRDAGEPTLKLVLLPSV